MSSASADGTDGVQLRDVLWQALPDTVFGVRIGPDQRLWIELKRFGKPPGIGAIRDAIEREFRKQAPEVPYARPVLFEPNGRVWFVTQIRTHLLGYDGENWVVREAPAGHTFATECRGHGRRNAEGSARHFAGQAFFLDSCGVHSWDGNTWRYQQFIKPPEAQLHQIYLQEASEGNMLFACVVGDQHGLWRWQGGEWTRVEIDVPDTKLLAPWSKDRAWFQTAAGYQLLPLKSALPSGHARLLEELKNAADDGERRRIATALAACGIGIKPDIERAISTTYDPEIIEELVFVLQHLSPAKGGFTLGRFRVEGARQLWCDYEGTAYIGADAVWDAEQPVGPALVIARIDGTEYVITGEEAAPLLPGFLATSGPLALTDRDAIWFPGGRKRCAHLVDLASGRCVDSVPDPEYPWLEAITREGRLFVRQYPGSWPGPLMVYTPGAPDDRRFVEAQRLEIRDHAFCVAADGSVWTDSVDKGLVRFDGEQWAEVGAFKTRAPVRVFLPVAQGDVLVKSDQGCSYIGRDHVCTRADLRTVVSECREQLRRSVVTNRSRGGSSGLYGIAVDLSGNIWLLEARMLSVLVDDRWVSAKAKLLEAGSRSGEVEYLSTIGDGSRVYMTDFGLAHDRGRSFYGRVEDGKIVIEPAPHTSELREMYRSVRDESGALWVPGSVRRACGTSDRISGQVAYRLTETGVVDEVVNGGWATLHDKGGNVWLGGIRGKGENQFNVWRNGEIVAHVVIPFAHEDTPLFSDRPGSVYAWTDAGLQHLTQCEESDPSRWSIAGVYTPTNIEGHRHETASSDLGFIVLTTYSDAGGRRSFLHLIPFPGQADDSGTAKLTDQ
ncbi:MAG: hypothetical protein JXB13_07310 [Phycisphaerae bacterium]|nr:hypothetical protein [Phycisphaerae bacterium]